MAIRLSVCSAALALTAVTTIASARASAQGIHLDVSGGTVTPVGPTNGNVDAGGHIGIGVSRDLGRAPITLGVEASFVRFGETELLYSETFPCAYPGCTASQPGNSHLGLANYFATGKYRLGTGVVHPYIAIAGGVTQKWASSTYNGTLHGQALGAGGRAGGGVEAQLGRVGIGLDVSYATESGVKYEGNLVRYVPVTLRLSF